MKITSKLLLTTIITIVLSSCGSYKRVAYFQDIDEIKEIKNINNYEPRIQKNDLLTIMVSAADTEVVTPYNLKDNIPYLVDVNGCIYFPILGKIKVEGLTLRELSDNLTSIISNDVKNPVISVAFRNHKITILGEVRAPGTYNLSDERTTILQAIGMAGDLNLGAKRDNVLLIREADGQSKHIRIDLRKSDILSSPYYYVCPNDVIYVTPTSSRAYTGSNKLYLIPIVTSTLSVVISVITLIIK
ncbi:polysaccharide biosynthesis/export family protein [Bacteroides sp. 519]|uniref:polysaccharide biosynthesis/export family protein n=1 Tax=Bacteroides sp. 519 TaxID=2302937 RepID=UPI0013D259D4|nr:polysaccharide biosynthesis/export family protein [Bacteroides sp. 519]